MILARFAWLRALAGIRQDSRYHAEGDVLTHTRMVAEVLVEMAAWRSLPAAERAVVFGAALLARASARARARGGEQRGRMLLWRGEGLERPAPFAWREQVAKLVRHH